MPRGVGFQAHAPQPRGQAAGWTRPGAQARWRGAWLGQRHARLPTGRWVALPGRLASDLLRPGYNSSRFRVKGRSVLPARPRVPGRTAPLRAPHTPPRLEAPILLASACFTATVLGAPGKAGIKFFQAGLERAGEGGPCQPQPPWRAGRCSLGVTATLGALLWAGASPRAPAGPTRAPPPPTRFPSPVPSPASARTGPSVSGPACAGVAAVPAASPGLPPWAPGPHSSPGSASGEARDSEGGRGGGPGHPSSHPARLPGLWELARWERQGRGGRWRGGRCSSATPVTSGATRLPCLPLPLCSLPLLPLARAKWPWRRYARAGVSRAGENGVHPGRAEAGGPGPRRGVGRDPFDRERMEGRARGWVSTNLPREKKKGALGNLCAPREEAWDPHTPK